MKKFWDDRYASEEYIYGVKPNQYFKDFIDNNKPGEILLPGEGEGRNAVYAARNGWRVYATDQSISAKEKALKLATINKISINYNIEDITHTNSAHIDKYEAIGLFFIHLPAEIRKSFHKTIIQYLKDNGQIVLMGFTKKQLEYGTGGPQSPDMLFSLEDLRKDFSELTMIEGEEHEILLDEGEYHKGLANVVKCTFILESRTKTTLKTKKQTT